MNEVNTAEWSEAVTSKLEFHEPLSNGLSNKGLQSPKSVEYEKKKVRPPGILYVSRASAAESIAEGSAEVYWNE